MIQTKPNYAVLRCRHCGDYLRNPGGNKVLAVCCGDLQRWFERDGDLQRDDGRDDRGRFHHKPTAWARLP